MSIPRSQDGVHFSVQTSTVQRGLPTIGYKTSSKEIPSDKVYDVVVLGAGYTGLIAARDVAEAGASVLLVEGRDRVGGRTWTCEMMGNKFEMGGEWVHWIHPHIWSELSRYGLTEPKDFLTTQGSAAAEFCSLHKNNPTPGPTKFLDRETVEQRMEQVTKAFFDIDGQGGTTIFPWPYEPLSNLEAVKKYDSLTVRERLNQLVDFSKEDLMYLYSNLVVFGSTPPEEASFLAILRYYALAGYSWSRLLEVSDHFKLTIGHSGMANLIFDDFAVTGDSIFGDPVRAVDSQPGSVTMALQSGKMVRSKRIICTLPLHCLSDVDFQPPLPSQFTSRHPNYGGKVHIHIDSKIPYWCGFGEPGAPVDCLLTDRYSDMEGTFLTGFPGGWAKRAGRQVVDDPERFLQATFKSYFPSEWASKPTDLIWHDWNTDPFSNGQWGAWGAGQLTTDFKTLSESAYISNEVILANSDWARGWTGWVDGAAEEGKRAAAHVVRQIRRERAKK
ncbi:hypothetical protein H2204_008825 [Knufia peltigerae]|uniref:Amine oxidase n=1 Tax=Knufia peltigerae TaxID=1002370 RepID=A0AA38XZ73_9EURO|nr:hypothetical protein H2204_008825 [Knufia peltigerae]